MNRVDREKQISKLLLCLVFSLLLFFSFQPIVFSTEKWPGVDESVVEKYAQEHGRAAMKPLINTDQGDLLLFLFLLAGVIGGFIAGYSWRMLMVEKKQKVTREEKEIVS